MKSRVSIWVVMSALFAMAGAAIGYKAHAQITAYLHPPRVPAVYLNRVEFLSSFPPQGAVAFVGDSQIERADWNALLGRSDIANYGVSGDDTEGLLRRLDAVERSGAKTAVVLIGINDLAVGRAPEAVAANVRQIVARLGKSIRVILVSVMPTSMDHANLNGPVADLDTRLAAACTARCTYVDLSKVLGAALPEQFTDEGLHLNPDGYRAIAGPIKAAL